MPIQTDRRAVTLQAAVTKAANFSGSSIPIPGKVRSLLITLDITAAERDSANETYDFYITTSDGVSSWDIAHFPQVATTGAKRFTAVVIVTDVLPQTVTTAGPGVIVVGTATMQTDTAGTAQGIKTLAAGLVRHGPIGPNLGHELVVAGTIVTGIAYSITVVPGVN